MPKEGALKQIFMHSCYPQIIFVVVIHSGYSVGSSVTFRLQRCAQKSTEHSPINLKPVSFSCSCRECIEAALLLYFCHVMMMMVVMMTAMMMMIAIDDGNRKL